MKLNNLRFGNGFLCGEILFVLLIGLVIRYILGIYLSFPDDVQSWGLTIANFEAGGGLYGLGGYYYAPPWGYILGITDFLGEPFGVSDFGTRISEALLAEDSEWVAETIVPSVSVALMTKTALFLSDIAVGYLIWKLMIDRTGDRRKAVIAFTLWFLCPFVITAGATQGMFDTIGTLLTLLTVLLAMRNRCFLAGMCFACAVLMKVFPAFLLFPILAYVIVKNRNGLAGRKILEAILGAVVIIVILLIPQMMEGTLSEAFSFVTSRTGNMGDGLGPVVSIATIALYGAIMIASIFLGRWIYKSNTKDLDGLLLLVLMINISIIFLYPANAQYLVLLVPFLLVQLLTSSEKYKLPLIVLMIGTPIFAMSAGPVNLLSVAEFTGLLSIDSVISLIETFNEPFAGGISLTILLHLAGVVEYLGVVLVLWTFHNVHKESQTAVPEATNM